MFTNTEAITIPEGDAIKIEYNGIVLWELSSSYTNQVPKSIDIDGSIYNSKGYKMGYRLSSSGVEKELQGALVTGYILAKSADTVYIGGDGVEWLTSNHQAANYVCCYDSTFKFICAQNCTGSYTGGTVSGDTIVAKVSLPTNENIAYVRVSDNGQSASTASKLIVTINEEII